MNIDIGASSISALFKASRDQPFFVGRNGTIEVETVFFWITHRKKLTPEPYMDHIRQQIVMNAGIFPAEDESIDRWCEAYVKALASLDGLAAGWYKPLEGVEAAILNMYTKTPTFRCPLRSLEPYYVHPSKRWTQHLAGKRVAVVSSFATTIEKQLKSGAAAKVWTADCSGMISDPTIEWSFVRTGYSPHLAGDRAGWPAAIRTWEQAVDYVVEEVVKSGAEIALIGCGGLGMVIGGRLREKGISAMLLGGAVQVLFGIKGRRWAKHDIISLYWNDAWVWPADEETPRGATLVERGCYWG